MLKGWGLGLGGEVLVGMNTFVDPPRGYRPNRETQVVRPSDMIGVGDGWLWPIPPDGKLWADGSLDDCLRIDTDVPSFEGWPFYEAIQKVRHNARFNIWFCDGHIEKLRMRDMVSGDEDKLRRWNNDNLPHRDLVHLSK